MNETENTGSYANAELARLGYDPELKRAMSLADVIIFGLIYMVPIAPIAVFGLVYNFSAGAVGLVYIVAATAMVFSAISYREMAQTFPIAGSVYSYVRYGINQFVGFLSGWAILLDYLLMPALLSCLAASAMVSLVPSVPAWVWVIGFVVITAGINLRGISFTARMNKIFLVIQLVVLGVFVVWALVAVAQGKGHFSFDPIFSSESFSWTVVFGAIPLAALSFVGFDGISTLNEEAKGGGKTVARATMIILWICTALFVLQVYLAAIFVPTGTVFADGDDTNNAFYNITGEVMANWFQIVLTLTTALIALFANILASNGISSRLVFSMARDRQLPAFLSKVHPKTQVPANAMIFIMAVSLVVGVLGVENLELLTSLVTFGALTAYIMLHFSVLVHFGVKMKSRKVFAHYISPVLGAGVLIYALWSGSFNAKVSGLIWLAIGVAIALYFRKTGRSLVQSEIDAPEAAPTAVAGEPHASPAVTTQKER
ncbi:APC family permease [Rhodococcus sp. IEGM 1354]|uniref:APC family permease n=1 Tax=unclassified Rhodococcus (in: high G+C Gram-positive bacteria) TaxID=192944 RepID=UPI001FD66188|nr:MULTISPECIES: APC family permease [unclassified Rhodococcus (in: high G+C Gram-positive bacteria)]MDI9933784.1 APC family permease [Rhodococcus sp. IEGM 1354]